MIIKQDLAPVLPGKNCFGRFNKKKFLVIHQTGNAARGANAQMHATYQINNTKYKDPREASWHYSVDDKEAIQSFTHDVSCYHTSDGSGDGNMHSIAIEGCINADGNYIKSVENMARLAAKILKDEKISIMNMKQHYDFARDKKNCPAQIRGGKDGIDWAKFVQMVQGFMNEKPVVAGAKVEKPKTVAKPKPVTKPIVVAPNKTVTDSYKETGTFYPNDTIIVRNAPSTNATIVAKYYKGEHVKYHTIHLKNGYVWLQYKRANGQQAYIPCRTYSNGKYGTLWGTIK